MSLPNGSIGKRIKERREELEMTQEKLAQELGLSQSLIWRWESGGITQIRKDNVDKLAKALRCDPKYLVYGYSGKDLPAEVEDWLHNPKNVPTVINFYTFCKSKEMAVKLIYEWEQSRNKEE